MKSLLVFGASGFIGGCLVQAARASGWQAVAVTRQPGENIPGADSRSCDITVESQVLRLLETTRPSTAANLAAAANIDRAEVERAEAYQVNVSGAASIARACSRLGIRLVHYSSDAVYDGSQSPIRESDPPNPLNYYGFTKSMGDQQVLQLDPQAVILRISLALGFPAGKNGNSFLAMLRTRLSAGTEVYAPEDELRTPVDIHTLCAASLELADQALDGPPGERVSGVLNIGARQCIDRYSLTVRLVERMGFDPALVRRAGPPLPGRAPRHRTGNLDVSRAARLLRTPMLEIDETIERAVRVRS